ncbi:RING-H2 finger protein ATL8-like [Punica granatum]|uniref:RING-type E3 ubiquitin transferase n=2 Tax=Punica granatum TaxID=22663 RepID=A0A218W7P4_PUNGR|nr:RING-H2 finger protein ATL8-like [Punica granatum]OWM68340.1 hypothetical protein CDL15_Pgr004822 [Punica granatum]PKI57055.1 hypothetical protein CRG98_022559 [Punica granatum]
MTRPQPSSATTALAPPPAEATNMESDFVIILAALLCALICVVGLIAVVRCTWLRRGSSAGLQSPSVTTSHYANKGVKKKVLQSLPKFTYTSSSSPSSSAWPASKFTAECSICLTEFAEGDEVRVLPQCGHVFHVACIDTWLGSHSSCPSCRQVLVVGRCQKCGGFPVAHGGGSGSGPAEAELKEREDAELGNRNDGGFLP